MAFSYGVTLNFGFIYFYLHLAFISFIVDFNFGAGYRDIM